MFQCGTLDFNKRKSDPRIVIMIELELSKQNCFITKETTIFCCFMPLVPNCYLYLILRTMDNKNYFRRLKFLMMLKDFEITVETIFR